MRIVRCTFFSLFLGLLLVFSHLVGLAQDAKPTEEILTNDTIITLTKAGLNQTILIGKIQSTKTNFNLSVDELLRLKKENVADEVVAAMFKKSTPDSPQNQPSNNLEELFAKNNESLDSGRVTLIEGSTRSLMKSCRKDVRTPGIFRNPLSMKTRVAFEGNHAQLRVNTNLPEFELSLSADSNPSDTLDVVKLTVKSDRREIETMRASMLGGSTGLQKSKLLPISVNEIPSSGTSQFKLYRVKLINQLPPGEYALVVGQSGFFDFGVDTTK